MAMKQANAKQKQWLTSVADFASSELYQLYGQHYDRFDFQIHHVKGRSYKQNKVTIGHWFVIPVPVELHDVNSNHELNVTHHKHAFTGAFGLQRELFNDMYFIMKDQGYAVPDLNILNAILEVNE